MNIELHLIKQGWGIMQFSKEKFLPNGSIVLFKRRDKKGCNLRKKTTVYG